jgi:hypothetical protein
MPANESKNWLGHAALLLAFTFSAGACKFNERKSADRAGSNLASIRVGTVDKSKVNYDSTVIYVKSAGGTSSRYSKPAELAAAKFNSGESVELRIELLASTGNMVAGSSSTAIGGKCDPVTLKLKSGRNRVKVPICLAGDDANNSSIPPIFIEPPADDADIEADPCIVNKENCDDNDGSNSGPNTGGQTPKKYCYKSNAMYKDGDGGCQFLGSSPPIIFSNISNTNGVAREILRTEARSYCDTLIESGKSDWRLATVGEMRKIAGTDPEDYLGILNLRSEIGFVPGNAKRSWAQETNTSIKGMYIYSGDFYPGDGTLVEQKTMSIYCVRN